MFCPNCGTKQESDVRYCGNYGASINAREVPRPANSVMSERHAASAGQARFSAACAAPCPPVEVKPHYVNSHQQAAAAFADEMERRRCASEAERLRKSLCICRIVGIVLAVTTITSMNSYMSDAAAVSIFMGVSMFFVPYGLAPILRWTGSHGFFIVFNWILILFAFIVLITIAIIVGPIYIIAAHAKIKEYDAMAAC